MRCRLTSKTFQRPHDLFSWKNNLHMWFYKTESNANSFSVNYLIDRLCRNRRKLFWEDYQSWLTSELKRIDVASLMTETVQPHNWGRWQKKINVVGNDKQKCVFLCFFPPNCCFVVENYQIFNVDRNWMIWCFVYVKAEALFTVYILVELNIPCSLKSWYGQQDLALVGKFNVTLWWEKT